MCILGHNEFGIQGLSVEKNYILTSETTSEMLKCLRQEGMEVQAFHAGKAKSLDLRSMMIVVSGLGLEKELNAVLSLTDLEPER